MKICLIGSTRFMEQYIEANKTLTLRGNIVYTVATISTASAMKPTSESPITEEEKMILDLVHLKKIAESDLAVLVTDASGYYGFSTKREMIWTGMIGKDLALYIPGDKEKGRDPNLYSWGPTFGPRRILDLPSVETLAKLWDDVVNPRPEPEEPPMPESRVGNLLGLVSIQRGGEA